jgi:hypothetical protein
MKRWYLELSLVGVMVVTLGAAGLRISHARPDAVLAPPVEVEGKPHAAISADSMDLWMAEAIDGNPFRLSRQPSVRVVTASGTVAQQLAQPPRPPRPMLVLKAIVGGPPWQAIVAGLPGQQGETVVSSGARFETLVVQSIMRDLVVIQAPDTAWRLTIKRETP